MQRISCVIFDLNGQAIVRLRVPPDIHVLNLIAAPVIRGACISTGTEIMILGKAHGRERRAVEGGEEAGRQRQESVLGFAAPARSPASRPLGSTSTLITAGVVVRCNLLNSACRHVQHRDKTVWPNEKITSPAIGCSIDVVPNGVKFSVPAAKPSHKLEFGVGPSAGLFAFDNPAKALFSVVGM